jgi:SAM-dependent methyltransferase
MIARAQKVLAHLRHDGIARTLALAFRVVSNTVDRWRDDAVDRKYGIDTRGVVEPYETDHIGEHGGHSTGHEPIQRVLFLKIIRSLRIDPQEFTFVDFGSGKGRAVILAAHFPFAAVVGIEFSPTLHRTARANVAKFQAKYKRPIDLELRCEDAALAKLPETPLLCFFYNPFGPMVIAKVLENLRISLERNPRKVLVVYRNPVHAQVFDKSEFLRLCSSTQDYRVYSNFKL